MKERFKAIKMRGCLFKLDKGFKSYEHLKIEKNAKNQTTKMGALQQQQRNLQENSVNPEVTSKFI